MANTLPANIRKLFFSWNKTWRNYKFAWNSLLCTQNMYTSLNTHGLFHLFCRCDNGHISAYLGGQDINEDAADEIFCGSTLPNALTTRNPRLLLILDTHGRVPGKGFKADYNFVTGMSSHLTVQSSMMWAVFKISTFYF